jgi:hypothetical protein
MGTRTGWRITKEHNRCLPKMFNISNSRGFAFIPFLLANWQLIAIGLLVLTVYGYYRHCESVKADYFNFVEKTKLAGEEQERKSKETIARNLKEKERSDESYKWSIARLERDNKRLRDSTRTSILPTPAPGSPSPQRACFSRADLDRAFNQFIADVAGIAGEGDRAVIGLDSAKEWAANR